MKIKQFACWKKETWMKGKEVVKVKPNEKYPDFDLTARAIVNGEDKFVTIGSGWSKTTKDGKKFISFAMKDAYMDMPGFVITEDLDVTLSVDDLSDF